MVPVMSPEMERSLRQIFGNKDLATLQNMLVEGVVDVNSVNAYGQPLLLVRASFPRPCRWLFFLPVTCPLYI
jgi:hypothetical protein